MIANSTRVCPSCKGLFRERSNVTHPYVESSPGCWESYGRVLAREYSDRSFFVGDCIHKLTVDTYAAQHPGKPSIQSIRSVGFHLSRMCLILEKGLTPKATQKIMVEISNNKDQFFWLTPPTNLGPVTVNDVERSTHIDEHKKKVQLWAQSVWDAWQEHHPVIYQWLNAKG